MTEQDKLHEEIRALRLLIARDAAKIREAQTEARRRVMEHATYHPETRTYTISELTLAAWGLR
jgi:hypothetical protein